MFSPAPEDAADRLRKVAELHRSGVLTDVEYAAEKKLDVRYAVDPKGVSWGVFQTKSMPTNFLIARGGKVVSIAYGCDASGLLANTVSVPS